MTSQELMREAARYRKEADNLRRVGGRVGLYQHERDHVVAEAIERAPKPIGMDGPRWSDRPQPFMVPGDSVALPAASMLGLLTSLADAQHRAAYLEARSMEMVESANLSVRLQAAREVKAAKDECERMASKLRRRKAHASATEAKRKSVGDRRRRNAR